MNTTNQRLFNQTPKDSNLVEQEVRRDDIGFGTKLTDSLSRLINQDGTFNIVRVNGTLWDRLNIYNRLITMGWLQFMGWLILFYVTANTFFAGIYMLADPNMLKAASDKPLYGPFWKCFFFSSQTLTTVGYGHIAPDSFLTSSIAAFESMIGLLAFALATGLLYGRFSRSTPHIRFSKQSVLAPYLDINGWMFRIINTRSNQLINIEITVSLSRLETGKDGAPYRRYYNLTLERRKVAFFPTNWTIVHPITEDSPLYGCTPEDLQQSDTEFLISLHALDDTFVQNVHTRFSYRFNEVMWGYKFRPMFDGKQETPVQLDLNKLDEVQEAPLN